jgi:hypothetical protein
MRFLPGLNGKVKTPKPTDLSSALMAAESALLDLARLARPEESNRAETSDVVRVESDDPDETLRQIIEAMADTLKLDALGEAVGANAQFATKARRELNVGVELLLVVSREFEGKVYPAEVFRLAMRAFHVASRLLYAAASLVSFYSAANDHLPDDAA